MLTKSYGKNIYPNMSFVSYFVIQLIPNIRFCNKSIKYRIGRHFYLFLVNFYLFCEPYKYIYIYTYIYLQQHTKTNQTILLTRKTSAKFQAGPACILFQWSSENIPPPGIMGHNWGPTWIPRCHILAWCSGGFQGAFMMPRGASLMQKMPTEKR